jgi:hypothetical protein
VYNEGDLEDLLEFSETKEEKKDIKFNEEMTTIV